MSSLQGMAAGVFFQSLFCVTLIVTFVRIASDNSLNHPIADSSMRRSQESAQPSIEGGHIPATPVDSKPFPESKFGSLRSILKPNNTPGTGQSVRFFSRDAYRVISPDQSSTSEFEDPSLVHHLQRSTPRLSVQNVFPAPPPQSSVNDDDAAPGIASLMQPIPPPELGNIFDLSAEEPPTIPVQAAPLLDSAIEISDIDDQSMTLDTIDEKSCIEELTQTQPLSGSPTIKLPPPVPDRAQSFSFGQTLMQSIAIAEAAAAKAPPQPNRNRAMSDSVFTALLQSPVTKHIELKRPEAEINDTSKALIAYQAPAPAPERDPFAANATTYYTPGTVLPPSPPQFQHSRTASKEEDKIWSLRTQLTLQSEMCAQYEVDLAARDETVEVLNVQLTEATKECERRKNIIRGWKKRVLEMEKCVHALEEELDRSREESAERSVMDEASGEALRMLHVRINELEREKMEGRNREAALRAELEAKSSELSKMQEDRAAPSQARDEPELVANEESEYAIALSRIEEDSQIFDAKSLQADALNDPGRAAGPWNEERAELLAANAALRDEQVQLCSQIKTMQDEVDKKEDELSMLKSELEAQWQRAERHGEDMEKLQQQKEALAREAGDLRKRLSAAEKNWDESRRTELEAQLEEAWTAKDELEKERDEVRRYIT